MCVVYFRRRRRLRKNLHFFQASRVDFILFFNDLRRNKSTKHLSTVSIIHQNHLGKSIYMKGQEATFSKSIYMTGYIYMKGHHCMLTRTAWRPRSAIRFRQELCNSNRILVGEKKLERFGEGSGYELKRQYFSRPFRTSTTSTCQTRTADHG